MAHIPPFEQCPLSDNPDEIETLIQEAGEFLQATDDQVATDVALHQRDQLERHSFQESMRAKLTEAGKPNVVDTIRADKDNIFADELLMTMAHNSELPAAIKARRKG